MRTGDFLSIHPLELKFPFELRKQSSCSMQLTNKTDKYVAFKVRTTNVKKYYVRPNTGIILPGSSCNVTVTMQAPKEAPPDMQCKDKFLLQSVIAPNAATKKDISPELFNKEDGKVIEEFKLRVVYIPANPPSPVREGSEEDSSPRASVVEDGNQNAPVHDALTRFLEETKEKPSSSETRSVVTKLTDEKTYAIQQNQKLCQQLVAFQIGLKMQNAVGSIDSKFELARRDIGKRNVGGFSILFVVLVGLLGFLAGYLIKT